MALSTVRMLLRRPERLEAPTDLYAHTVPLLAGGELDLAQLRGRPTLIVNTASKCGFKGQFGGLQELYDRYHDRGLQVLGTPSGDFAGQEHDDADAIGAFCQRNYGVTFPLTAKLSVREDPHPLWADLARQPGSGPPAWNFTKYLVAADGRLLARFPTRTAPLDDAITLEVETALSEV